MAAQKTKKSATVEKALHQNNKIKYKKIKIVQKENGFCLFVFWFRRHRMSKRPSQFQI